MAALDIDSVNAQAGGAFFLLFGMLAAIIGVSSGVGRVRLWRNGKRVTGVITALETYERTVKRRARTFYVPVIGFRAEDGSEHVWKREQGESRPGYKVGDQVPMIYDAADPGRAMIGTFAEAFGAAIAFTVLGSFFAVIGWMLVPHDIAAAFGSVMKLFGGR